VQRRDGPRRLRDNDDDIPGTICPNLAKVLLHVAYDRGSVPRWRCDTLCTSAFVDDVMFENDGHAEAISDALNCLVSICNY